jgi:hypothetical protein
MRRSGGRRLLVFAAAAVGFASAASAQPAAGDAAARPLELPFGPIPKEIHGVACEVRPGNADFAPSLNCAARDPLKQPSISVAVSDARAGLIRADLAANERRAFQGRPIFNVVREEGFVPPADPSAIGYRALYQTELGNRYVWAVASKGKLVRVLVIVFAPTDFGAMIRDVEAKVYGVGASPPAAQRDSR